MTCKSCKYITSIKQTMVSYKPSGHWMISPFPVYSYKKVAACGRKSGKPKKIPKNRIACKHYESEV